MQVELERIKKLVMEGDWSSWKPSSHPCNNKKETVKSSFISWTLFGNNLLFFKRIFKDFIAKSFQIYLFLFSTLLHSTPPGRHSRLHTFPCFCLKIIPLKRIPPSDQICFCHPIHSSLYDEGICQDIWIHLYYNIDTCIFYHVKIVILQWCINSHFDVYKIWCTFLALSQRVG